MIVLSMSMAIKIKCYYIEKKKKILIDKRNQKINSHFIYSFIFIFRIKQVVQVNQKQIELIDVKLDGKAETRDESESKIEPVSSRLSVLGLKKINKMK